MTNVLTVVLSFHGVLVSSFVVLPIHNVKSHIHKRYPTIQPPGSNGISFTSPSTGTKRDRAKQRTMVASTIMFGALDDGNTIPNDKQSTISSSPSSNCCCTWSPQDLTKDSVGFVPIPNDDYIKKYQNNPELWPVEFFIIAYRRQRINNSNNKMTSTQTQILVRESANGTSKWGLGTGVPVTRWMLSTPHNKDEPQQCDPPLGYKWSTPPPSSTLSSNTQEDSKRITFDASNFPEFPKTHGKESWTYTKIDICEDAFHNNPNANDIHDPELEEYATKIRDELKLKISEMINMDNNNNNNNDEEEEGGVYLNSWESSRLSVIKDIVDKPNCVAAIQGTLRMSGLFAYRDDLPSSQDGLFRRRRYVNLDKKKNDTRIPDPTKLVSSMRIYTMFPQMPDPMPLPSTSPEDLQKEIVSRDARMVKSGRDPHKDRHGRVYTHKSTSNVSNTIHGIYLTLDVTDLLGGNDDDDNIPALDLFGTRRIKREWKSLEDLKVLDDSVATDGESSPTSILSTEDTKSTFISGFIVRQLVKDGVIDIHG